jgi:hypothetical protein
LADAGRFIGTMPERDQGRQAWIHATEILMAAAERDRSIEEQPTRSTRRYSSKANWNCGNERKQRQV